MKKKILNEGENDVIFLGEQEGQAPTGYTLIKIEQNSSKKIQVKSRERKRESQLNKRS